MSQDGYKTASRWPQHSPSWRLKTNIDVLISLVIVKAVRLDFWLFSGRTPQGIEFCGELLCCILFSRTFVIQILQRMQALLLLHPV
mmetsp:Transcript_159319/g.305671  ORF Transcript_159319/g.305671 Transcript_159319/m.305671 type:complete len:86 (-) Transcript_159319:205-462(-)